MDTTCQASYPLNSENASPFGTFAVYLSWPARASATRTERDAPTKIPTRVRLRFMSNLLVYRRQQCAISRDRIHPDMECFADNPSEGNAYTLDEVSKYFQIKSGRARLPSRWISDES